MAKEPSEDARAAGAADGHSGSSGERYQEKHAHIRGRGVLSSAALGLADGLVTNLAFLTGFGGTAVGLGLIQFAGVAATLAGAVSMFFGGVLSARSELDLFRADTAREGYEIENEPDEELAELTDLYKEKGLTEEDARAVVLKISSSKEKFLEDMLANELHIHKSNLQNPLKLGTVMGLSFLLGAVVPLIPYYALPMRSLAMTASVVLSLSFLFAAGAWKGVIVKRRFWESGLETALIGAVAALILYMIGSELAFA